MNNEILASEIKENYPFSPTSGQETAIGLLSLFVCSEGERKAFLLKGYAGTGKTTLVGALVKTLRHQNIRVVLLAPTGRAAKVFSSYSGYQANTIHKKIYRQKNILDSSSFVIDRNLSENTLFLVDEASMIPNEGLSGSMFGSGRLVDDLISYVYQGKNCRLGMLGDQAQLPPVLSVGILSHYGLEVTEVCLDKVMRQGYDSGILYNATLLRQVLDGLKRNIPGEFRFRLDGFGDVKRIRGDELIEAISDCYSRDGQEETMVLCRSNKRANVYNEGIRRTVLDREDERLVAEGETDSYIDVPSFIANGDIAVISRIRRQRELYGFRFVDAVLTFPDYNDLEMDVTLLLDTLHSEAPSLTREESDKLFNSVMEDYADISNKKEKMKLLRENKHFNALQIKYAYAVTCHKAQGGQWKNIFIDQGYVTPEMQDEDYYRWLYTALTRATQTVYLVNWPE